MRLGKWFGVVFLAAFILMACTFDATRAAPPSWSSTLASNVTIASGAFPATYALDFGYGLQGTVRIKATCACGAVTMTFKIQGSMDGTTWDDAGWIAQDTADGTSFTLTGTNAVDDYFIPVVIDGATVGHPGLYFPRYQLVISKSGGSPSLTGVTIQTYAPGKTR